LLSQNDVDRREKYLKTSKHRLKIPGGFEIATIRNYLTGLLFLDRKH